MNIRLLLFAPLFLCYHLKSQNPVVFSASNITVHNGDNFTMDIKTQGFSDVSSFSFSLSWDEALIDFDTIITFNADLPLNISNFNITRMVTDAGQLAVSWFDISGVGKSLADQTVLFEIKFKALSNPGSSLLDFTDDLTPVIAENILGVLPVNTLPGTITVQEVNSTDDLSTWGDLSIYPNPAHGYLRLQYSLLEPSSVIAQITDLNGKLLEQQQYANAAFGEINFDTSNLSSGNYIVRVVAEHGVAVKPISIVR